MPLHPGLAASIDLSVTSACTASALRSGDVPVLATPEVVRLAEEATVAAIAGALPEGSTSVGYRVQLDHVSPIAAGETVHCEAILETVAGRRLTFRVTVSDGTVLVAAGKITRVVVERARFLEKAKGSAVD